MNEIKGLDHGDVGCGQVAAIEISLKVYKLTTVSWNAPFSFMVASFFSVNHVM